MEASLLFLYGGGYFLARQLTLKRMLCDSECKKIRIFLNTRNHHLGKAVLVLHWSSKESNFQCYGNNELTDEQLILVLYELFGKSIFVIPSLWHLYSNTPHPSNRSIKWTLQQHKLQGSSDFPSQEIKDACLERLLKVLQADPSKSLRQAAFEHGISGKTFHRIYPVLREFTVDADLNKQEMTVMSPRCRDVVAKNLLFTR